MLNKNSPEAFAVVCDNCGNTNGKHHVSDYCPDDEYGGYNKKQLFYSSKFPELNAEGSTLKEAVVESENDEEDSIPEEVECEGCDNCFVNHGDKALGYPCPIWDDDAEEWSGDFHPDTHFYHEDYVNHAWIKYQALALDPEAADPAYDSYSNDLLCAVCGCRKGRHASHSPHQCLGNSCKCCIAFRKPPIAACPSIPRELPSFEWKEISSVCFEAPMPPKLAGLANWLAKQESNILGSIWGGHISKIDGRLRNEDKTLLSSIKPGDWAIALVKQPHSKNNMLVCGRVAKDPVFPHLPAIRFARNGLLYEIDGVWLNKWGMNGLEGWSAHVVCATILTNDMLESHEDDLKASIPYAMGKEIFG